MLKAVLTLGGRKLGEWPILDTPLNIGRSRHAQIFIESPAVSENHCMIEPGAGDLILVDLGSPMGTLVNGRRVKTSPLKTGDVITVGTHTITITADDPTKGPAAPGEDDFHKTIVQDMDRAVGRKGVRTWKIKVRDRDLTRTITLEHPLYTIGAARDCDIVLEGKGITANHAVLINDGIGIRLLNVSGKKELSLNGRPAAGVRLVLTTGASVGIGAAEIILQE